MTIRAEMLRQTSYDSAAEWCEHIRDHLNLYRNHPVDLVQDLTYFLESFKTDFICRVEGGNIRLRLDCFEVVQVILEHALQNNANIDEILRQLVPLVDRSLTVNKPIYKMDETFNALDLSLLDVKLYGFLFAFLLHIDGQYFPAVRTLCALKLAGDGHKCNIEYVESLTLEQMENMIGKFGSPIFTIYNSVGRNLRNAIAHCNFVYTDGKLTCWDTNPRTKKTVWKKEFTAFELLSLINDIKSIEHALIVWSVLRELAEKVTRNVMHTGLQLNFEYGTVNLVKEKCLR
jgi:hypothetical protein